MFRWTLILVRSQALALALVILCSSPALADSRLDSALSGLTLSNLEVLTFQNGLTNARDKFMRLYREGWNESGLPESLDKHIDSSFKARTRKLLWGTKSLQLGLNAGNITSKIQRDVAAKFSGEYDAFIRSVESGFNHELTSELESFYRNIASLMAASDSNPVSRAYFRKFTSRDVLDVLSPMLSSSGLGESGYAMFRNEFAAYVRTYINRSDTWRKFANNAAVNLITENIPIIGQAIMLYSIYDLASMAWNSESDVRRILHERNQALYAQELPVMFWEVIEPHVIDMFVGLYDELQETRIQAFEFANEPALLEQYAELDEAGRIRFAESLLNDE